MSVAQDEITAQINAIKGEWSQTVSSLDSNEDAPSGLTRPEFKEWKQLKQQKAKFHLLQLEERLKRLHLLESRSPACLLSRVREHVAVPDCAHTEPGRSLCAQPRNGRLKVARASQVLPDSRIDLGVPSASTPSTAAGAAHRWGPQPYEYARISTGNSFRAGAVYADQPHEMFALPGAVPDSAHAVLRRPSTLSDGFERGLYERPPGLPRQTAEEDQWLMESKEMVRQMVRESLKLNLGAHGTKQGSSETAKLRESATLPVDLNSPKQVKNVKTPDGPLNKSADDTELPEEGEEIKGAAEAAGNVKPEAVDFNGQDTLKAGLNDKRVGFEVPAQEDEEKSSPQNDRKSVILSKLSQENGVQRASPLAEITPQSEEAFGVPNTLDEATEISCPWIFGGFKRTTPVRRFCFDLTKKVSFNLFLMLITIGNSVYIAAAPDLLKSNVSARRDEGSADSLLPQDLLKTLFYFDIFCAVVMGFEILISIVAYGFCRTRSTYLRSSGFHRLDMACMVVTILEYVTIILGLPDFTLRPFRILKFFKIICQIEMFQGVKNILTALHECFLHLMTILFLLFLTLAGWSLLCMAVYSKSFRRRCVNRDANIPACASDFSSGFGQTCDFVTDVNKVVTQAGGDTAISSGYPFERWCKIYGVEWDKDENGAWKLPLPFDGEYAPVERGYYDKGLNALGFENIFTYPKDSSGRYHSCQADLWRRTNNFTATQRCEVVGNPSGGFSHFDNVWGSVASISQVIVPDSYYEVWWRAQESEPLVLWATRILFVLINIIDTFMFLGLFVAVVTGTFRIIREQSQPVSAADKPLDTDNHEDDAQNPPGDQNISDGEAVQRAAIALTNSLYFETFISFVIMVNLVTIANYRETDSSWVDMSFYSTISCWGFFLLESTLRYLASGDLFKYWSSLFHRAEVFLVIITFVGIFADISELKVLGAFRGYRLMKYSPALQEMLQSAVASTNAVLNVIVFTLISGICFVVACRYMFGTLMDGITRANFGTFGLSAVTMFQLFTGDSWSGVMYASMQAFPIDQKLNQFMGASLVLTWFFFANVIARNVFVAVIVENFQISDTIASIKKSGAIESVRQRFRTAYGGIYRKSRAISSGAVNLDTRTGMMSLGADSGNHIFRNSSARMLYSNYSDIEEKIRETAEALAKAAERGDHAPDSRMIKAVSGVQTGTSKAKRYQAVADEAERVLFFLLPQHPVRKFFVWLGASVYFDTLIVCGIITSCVFLIIEPPYTDITDYPDQIEPESPLVSFYTMDALTRFFTFFFLVELVCRVMGQGFLLTRHAYLKDGWNRIDAIVVMFSVIELSGVLEGSSLARVVRMTRALKPLRLVKRNPGMRLIVDAVVVTLEPIFYVMLFLFFTVVVFGLVGIGVFGGKLFACTSANVAYPDGKTACAGTWVATGGNKNGVLLPAVWDNPYHFNFDSFSASFLSLFMTSTFKFVNIMWACMDITQVDISPVPNNTVHSSLFFVLYTVVGGLFVMNLFVAFIVEGFSAAKDLTVEDKLYQRFRRVMHASRPRYDIVKRPQNVVSTQIRKFIESRIFQAFSSACVAANVSLMLSENAGADENWQRVIDTQNHIFFGELVFEVVLCAIAYGPLGFYNDFYRFFDVLVCIGTVFGYIFNSRALGGFIKVFRLVRIIRLAARSRSFKLIIDTLVETAPQLINILLLLILVFSMFAVVGVQLFALTRSGMRLGPTASFRYFPDAFFLIWQLVTGDEWMIIMKDVSVVEPFCTAIFTPENHPIYNGPPKTWGDCGPGVYLGVFYCIFVKLVCEYTMLNLFIGIILDNFSFITEDAAHKEDVAWSNGPSERQLQDICSVFKRYDLGTNYVPISSLSGIMMDLPLPLGYREGSNKLFFTGNEYMIELLIRAELNLCIRHNNAKKKEEEMARWRFKKPELQQVFVNAVDYDDLISTITFWRLPSLIPGLIQWQRHERIEECVLMAHALKIMEFFRSILARKKMRKINDQMTKRRAFMHFCEEDPHRKRRNMHASEIKIRQKQCARDNKVPLLHFLNKPFDDNVRDLILNWIPASDVPEDIMTHSQACQAFHELKVPQPFTGIEVFRQKILTHEIVFKVIDPISNRTTNDLLIADLRDLSWRGWVAHNSKVETYYHPVVFNGLDDNGQRLAPESWDKIDMFVRSQKKGSRQKRIGSIEDLQSYVVEDYSLLDPKIRAHSEGKKRANRAHSFLRINLGNHQYNSDKVKLQAKNWKDQSGVAFASGLATQGLTNLKKFRGQNFIPKEDRALVLTGPSDVTEGDTVLEVVGYIPIVGLNFVTK